MGHRTWLRSLRVLAAARDSSIGPDLDLWGSADLLLRCPWGCPAAAQGPQLLHQHGHPGLQLRWGMGVVSAAKAAEVSHELLGHLVVTPAAKGSTSAAGLLSRVCCNLSKCRLLLSPSPPES